MKQVYYNGKVYTNTGGTDAQDEEMVTIAIGPAMALFDLHGGFVCPAFSEVRGSNLQFDSDRDFDEHVRGRIARGEKADFVVLGRSPFEVPDSDIKKIPILSIYKAGKEK